MQMKEATVHTNSIPWDDIVESITVDLIRNGESVTIEAVQRALRLHSYSTFDDVCVSHLKSVVEAISM